MPEDVIRARQEVNSIAPGTISPQHGLAGRNPLPGADEAGHPRQPQANGVTAAVKYRPRFLPMIASLAALGACAGPSTTEILSNRLQTGLSADTTCMSQARIEQASGGARVRIPEATLFFPGRADLTGCGQYTLASVTESFLDPRIMQVSIEPEPEPDVQLPGTAALLSRQRANAVAAWFADVAFLPMMRPILVVSDPAMARSDVASAAVAPMPVAAGAGPALASGADAALSGRSLGLLVQAVGYR